MSSCSRGILVSWLAQLWVGTATTLFGKKKFEKAREAKISLLQAIADIQNSEEDCQNEMRHLAEKVRQLDRKKHTVTMVQHVKRSKQLRAQIGMLSKKKMALQLHLDTLNTTELNQHVVQSVKDTSSALKSMGLAEIQNDTDEMVMDMQENLQDVQGIQRSLASAYEDTEFSDLDLEGELSILLDEDLVYDAVISKRPMPQNKMQSRNADESKPTDEAHTEEEQEETREQEKNLVASA